MQPHVLVTYATRYGSTKSIAEEIGRTLEKLAIDVRVERMDRVQDVQPYDGVIVGAPIYRGRWLRDAVRFLRSFRHDLQHRPLAVFGVGIEMWDHKIEGLRLDREHIAEALKKVPELAPVSIGAFAGVLHYQDHPFWERFILKRLGFPEGDFRNPSSIRGWANALGFQYLPPARETKLLPVAPPEPPPAAGGPPTL